MVPIAILSLVVLILSVFSRKIAKLLTLVILISLLFLLDYSNEFGILKMAFLIIFFSSYLYSVKENLQKEFYPLYLLLVSSVFGMFESKDIILSFVYFEMMCLISYILVSLKGDKISLKASLRYMYFGVIGSYLIIWSFIYMFSGNYLMFWTLFFLGVSVEVGVFPFSLWLPEAHSRAKSFISAILSGIVIETAMIFMMNASFACPVSERFKNIFVVFSPIFLVLPSLSTIFERDLKRILAKSSIVNMGVSLYLFLFGGIKITILYLVFHSVSKALAFLSSGKIVERFGRNLKRLNGNLLFSSIFLSTSVISLMGIPPLLGFSAKLFSIFEISHQYLISLIILFSLLILYFPYLRILERLRSFSRNLETFDEKSFSSLILFIFLAFLSFRVMQIA